MPLRPGTSLGAFEILAFIGAGGMGEVYRARDMRLGRVVALKVLPDAFLRDPERLFRFRREAQILASLKHPNIAAVHGLEEVDDRAAIVLELVEGEGLDARLGRGPVPTDEALGIMRQISEGLEAAHEGGVVHRDLKPANVKLTVDGAVKILDFGLAKVLQDDAVAASSSASAATVAHEATAAGMIVGTVAYMAPEQARGRPVDKRADIWAFGVVLFELLAGRHPFTGDTLSDTLAAVLTHEPDLNLLPPSTPPAVRGLLARCLQRDVRLRLRDIGEARIALSAPSTMERAPVNERRRPASSRGWLLPASAGGLLVAAIAAALVPWSQGRTVAESPLLTVGIDVGGDTAIAGIGWVGLNWVGPTAILSPDGRRLVFIARGPAGGRWQLYSRRLDELRARPLAGTEGAFAPFFSPDGESVGFFAAGVLKKVVLSGGTVTTICAAEEGRGGTWSQNGTIVFAPRPEGPLLRVSSDGGTAAEATTLDAAAGEASHRWPQFLPDGKAFIFTSNGGAGSSRGGNIVLQADEVRTPVHQGGLYGRYASSGHLLYVNEGTLFAAPFDVGARRVTGPAEPVVEEVAHATLNGTAQYSFSDTGLLTYQRARDRKRSLQWMEPSGRVQPLRTSTAPYQEMRFSPDGNQLVLVIGDGLQSDVWIYDIARDDISRRTFHPDNDWAAVWSPDAARIVYSSWRADAGNFNLFAHRADGDGEPQRLTTSPNRQLATEWHPDGAHILFSEERPGSGVDLLLLPIEITATGEVKPGTPRTFLGSAANELAGEFSPDGKWIAYTSDQSGRSEVYVQPFPGPGGRWQVSTEGAEWVEWRANGHLFYGRSEEVVMRVPYRIEGTTFIAGKPHVWMRIPPGVSWVDPTPDGTRAAGIRSEDSRSEARVLVVNFFEHLRRAVPAPR